MFIHLKLFVFYISYNEKQLCKLFWDSIKNVYPLVNGYNHKKNAFKYKFFLEKYVLNINVYLFYMCNFNFNRFIYLLYHVLDNIFTF